METIVPVKLGARGYSIHIGGGERQRLAERMRELQAGKQVFLVTDDQVGPRYAREIAEQLTEAGFEVTIAQLPAGECTKTLRHASELYDRMVTSRVDRKTTVVALGGGVVGDLTGFVAATFARGLRFVQIPTTLLAMVDASVGGKVAVDHPRAKNMIGAFHQPSLVVCDLDVLETLPDREFRCGMAEIVKYGVILDREFFEYIENNVTAINQRDAKVVHHLVARSCQIKADVVEKDEFETNGLRASLNYGHTFAHSFETAGAYSQLKHGEAVAIGMICASKLAERLALIDERVTQRQIDLWQKLGLPVSVPEHLLKYDLLGLMRSDKKAVGAKIRFVLPREIGQFTLRDGVEDDKVWDVLRSTIS